MVLNEIAKVSCTGNVGARPGCASNDTLCRGSVHVQVRGLIFPSNEWVNGAVASLSCGTVGITYETGMCGTNVFCEPAVACTPGFTMDFWATPHQRFSFTTTDSLSMNYTAALGDAASWQFDPTVIPSTNERCSRQMDASGVYWLIIN
jgi:hypothetical protein